MFEINLIFYGLSSMLQFSQFVWPLSYSVWDVFNNFLLIDATDRSKISSDQKRFFIALSLYPLSFFANTPFKDQHMLNINFNFKDTMKAHHILEISLDVQSFLCTLSFINYPKSKTIIKSFLNSHVYWDTLYNWSLLLK